MRYPGDLVPSDFAIKHWVLNPSGARKIHICAISNPAGVVLGIGHAICNPDDEYIRERGREIAQGRAIKAWSGHNGMKEVTLSDAHITRESADEEARKTLDEIFAFPAVLDDGSRHRPL